MAGSRSSVEEGKLRSPYETNDILLHRNGLNSFDIVDRTPEKTKRSPAASEYAPPSESRF